MKKTIYIVLYILIFSPFLSIGQKGILEVEYDSLTKVLLGFKNKIEIQKHRINSIKQIVDNNSVQTLKEKKQELTLRKLKMDSLKSILKSNKLENNKIRDLEKKSNKIQQEYELKRQQFISSSKEVERYQHILKTKQSEKDSLVKKITERISRDKANVNNIKLTIVSKLISTDYKQITEDINAFNRIIKNPYYKQEKTFSEVAESTKFYRKIQAVKFELTIPVQPNKSYNIEKAIVESQYLVEPLKSYYIETICLLQNYCKVTSEVINAVDRHLLFGKEYDYFLKPKYHYLYKELYNSNGTLKKFKSLEDLQINTNFECDNE